VEAAQTLRGFPQHRAGRPPSRIDEWMTMGGAGARQSGPFLAEPICRP
jgi:hypothetical protein